MKVVTPTRLLGEAAGVLEPVRDDVVVVGAAALDVALADAESVAVTATRDIDVVVSVDRAGPVVSHLQDAELEPSEIPYERGFTWVRGDLKVQLVRTFHPFPKPPATGFPENTAFGMAANSVHQCTVSFADDPVTPRLKCVNAACLLALKEAAFGRTRPPDDTPVERDFHDAYLLISAAADAVVADLKAAKYEVRSRAANAVSRLAGGGGETVAAARQMVGLRSADSQREAEATIRRAALRMEKRFEAELSMS